MKKILSLALILCSLSLSFAQSFEKFVSDLEKTGTSKRGALVKQYLANVKSTPVIEGKDKVHFVWFGKADTVHIEGELQTSWAIPQMMTRVECGGENLFYFTYTIPSDAFFEYRFIIGKQRQLDPKNNRVAQGFDFTDRNYFFMPDFIESPYLKTRYGITKGNVTQWTYKTEHKPFTNQPIWIYTPYGYSREKKYPVLYVYDGSSTLYTRPLLNVVNNLIHDQKIEPIVIVFVGFEDRWTEYVSESIEWAKLMKDELVPFIEKNFSVANTPDKRGVIGASASGHGAIVTAMQHPEIFGNVASQGGGAGGLPGLNPIANKALDNYLTVKDKTPLRKIYTEVGAFDLEFPENKIVFADGVYQFNQRLKENNIDHVFKKANGGHNSTVWNQSLAEILILFYGKN
jgi:enterochelin esterase-like enzyme